MEEKHAFILGGTKGLGRALAWESYERGIVPIAAGRSVYEEEIQKSLPPGTELRHIDLTDQTTFRNAKELPENVRYFFWNAGILLNNPFFDMNSDEQEVMIRTHLSGPWDVLKLFVTQRENPFFLVVTASTSAWRMRENESYYTSLKSAKATFARQISRELEQRLPGSKTLLVCPAGIKTELFKDGRDMSAFLDPREVAEIIWTHTMGQRKPFVWLNVERTGKGEPVVSYGPKLPELPSS